MLHNLVPLKLKTLSSIMAPRFFLVIPSPAVFCLSAVSQYLSSSDFPCSVLLLSCLVDESSLCVNKSKSSQSYITTDGQLASLSWNKAPI
jgi:hypothetical protein